MKTIIAPEVGNVLFGQAADLVAVMGSLLDIARQQGRFDNLPREERVLLERTLERGREVIQLVSKIYATHPEMRTPALPELEQMFVLLAKSGLKL